MSDKADVGLVDAHAEGNGSDDNDAILHQEPPLVALPVVGGQSGMVGQGRESLRHQKGGGVLDFLARQAIDNPRFVRVLGP